MSLWEDIFGSSKKPEATQPAPAGTDATATHATLAADALPGPTASAAAPAAGATGSSEVGTAAKPLEIAGTEAHAEPTGIEHYGQSMWSGLLSEATSAWNYFTGNEGSATQLSDEAFNSLSFDSAYGAAGLASGPTAAGADATGNPAAAQSQSGDRVTANGTVTDGSGATITKTDGKTTFKGSEDGNKVDITQTSSESTITAGGFSAIENKKTHSAMGTSGDFQFSQNNGVETLHNMSADTTTQYNSHNHHWSVRSHNQTIAGGDTPNSTSQAIVDGQVQTTTGNAGEAAQTAAATQGAAAVGTDSTAAGGAAATNPEYKIYVDKSGDYGIVSKNGLVIKTDKATQEVTLTADGHSVRMGPNHSVQVEQTGADGQTQWVNLKHGQKVNLPKGVEVSADGQVKVNGQTVVDNNNITLAKGTTIDACSGQMRSKTTDNKAVSVTGGDGQTTVQTQGQSTVQSNDAGTTVKDAQGKTVSHIDAQTQQIQMSDGQGGMAAINFNGQMTFQNDDGQRSVVNTDGSMQSWDAQGNSLFAMNSSGDITTYDGTDLNSDGSYNDSNSDTASGGYGDNSLSDADYGGVGADSMISAADGAADAAVASAYSGTANPGMLDSLEANLGAAAAQFSAQHKMDVVAQLDAAEGTVAAAKSQVAAHPKQQMLASNGSRVSGQDGDNLQVG